MRGLAIVLALLPLAGGNHAPTLPTPVSAGRLIEV
jgi:hypothetical protein